MAAGVKLRSRQAVRLRAQGFTRDDSPGEDECGVRGWALVIKSSERPAVARYADDAIVDFAYTGNPLGYLFRFVA
jgi:hypothetical protein